MRGPLAFFLRAFSGMLGLCSAGVALTIPLLFLANELQEAESAKQYGGHASLSGAIGGIALVLLIAGLFGTGAYMLLRFCFYGLKSRAVEQAAKN